MSLGAGLGVVFDNIALGIVIGTSIGLTIGLVIGGQFEKG